MEGQIAVSPKLLRLQRLKGEIFPTRQPEILLFRYKPSTRGVQSISKLEEYITVHKYGLHNTLLYTESLRRHGGHGAYMRDNAS